MTLIPCVSRAEGLARLSQLADLLLTVAPAEYDQGLYYHDCGTPSCALGHWATANPERWIALDPDPWGGSRARPILKGVDRDRQDSARKSAMLEFSLTREEAEELFDKYGCGGAGTNVTLAVIYLRQFVERQSLLLTPAIVPCRSEGEGEGALRQNETEPVAEVT